MTIGNKQIDWQEIKLKLERAEHYVNNPVDSQYIKNTYKLRAQYFAQRQAKDTQTVPQTSVLVFSLNNENYAIELFHLLEILPYKTCTPVPKTPSNISGVIDLRGEIRCVIDLAQLLQLKFPQEQIAAESDTNKGYILIMKKNLVGLKIDNLQHILYIDENQLVTKAGRTSTDYHENIKGILPGNIVLLDVDNLLSDPVFTSTIQ